MKIYSARCCVTCLIQTLMFFISVGAGQAFADTAHVFYAWGDSLTFGTNASNEQYTWPNLLSKYLGRTVVNKGFPGQTSQGIAERFGSLPLSLRESESQSSDRSSISVIPKDTSAFVGIGSAELPGTFGNVPGFLSESKGKFLFTPQPHTNLGFIFQNVLFFPSVDESSTAINILWVCRNDVYQRMSAERCLGNVKSMVDKSLKLRQPYLVLSVLNSTDEPEGSANYRLVLRINDHLANEYPNNFVDVRAELLSAAEPSKPGIISEKLRIRNGRDDGIHLNDLGYAVVAKSVFDAIRAHGW